MRTIPQIEELLQELEMENAHFSAQLGLMRGFHVRYMSTAHSASIAGVLMLHSNAHSHLM